MEKGLVQEAASGEDMISMQLNCWSVRVTLLLCSGCSWASFVWWSPS